MHAKFFISALLINENECYMYICWFSVWTFAAVVIFLVEILPYHYAMMQSRTIWMENRNCSNEMELCYLLCYVTDESENSFGNRVNFRKWTSIDMHSVFSAIKKILKICAFFSKLLSLLFILNCMVFSFLFDPRKANEKKNTFFWAFVSAFICRMWLIKSKGPASYNDIRTRTCYSQVIQ